MDFSVNILEENAKRWNYDSAVEMVRECDELAHSCDILKTDDTFTKIAAESYSKAIITTKEILTLLYHGYPEGAMALSRILYESMVVMQFMHKHSDNEELLKRYIDDYAVKVSRDRIKYCNYLLDYSQSEEERQEAQQHKVEARKVHNKLKQKYSEYLSYNKQGNYLHDYWWVGDVIQSRNFGAIQNEVTLDNLKILYVLSCYRAHSGVVGNNVRFGTVFDETVLSTKGSLDGFEIPLCFSLVCFGILTETMFERLGIACDNIIKRIENIIAPFENCLYR